MKLPYWVTFARTTFGLANLVFAVIAVWSCTITHNWLDACIGMYCLNNFTVWLEKGV